MVCILVPIAISGVSPLGAIVFAHESSTVLVALNALRVLNLKAK